MLRPVSGVTHCINAGHIKREHSLDSLGIYRCRDNRLLHSNVHTHAPEQLQTLDDSSPPSTTSKWKPYCSNKHIALNALMTGWFIEDFETIYIYIAQTCSGENSGITCKDKPTCLTTNLTAATCGRKKRSSCPKSLVARKTSLKETVSRPALTWQKQSFLPSFLQTSARTHMMKQSGVPFHFNEITQLLSLLQSQKRPFLPNF